MHMLFRFKTCPENLCIQLQWSAELAKMHPSLHRVNKREQRKQVLGHLLIYRSLKVMSMVSRV